jgi:hypothetical protein
VRTGRVRALASAAALGMLGACAQVLDIPNDLHFSPAPAAPVREPANTGASGVSSGQDVTGLTPDASAPDGSLSDPQVAQDAPDARASEPIIVVGSGAGDAGVDLLDAAPAPDAAPVAPACGSSQSLGPDEHCYAVLGVSWTWEDARAGCLALGDGWDLASIRSDEVNRFLLGLLSFETWIGGTDSAVEGTWLWVDDGVSFWVGSADAGSAVNASYVNWHPTEPNARSNSDCARVIPELDNVWADLQCTELRDAVCRGPLANPL